jgi:hypothetical protein
MCRDNLHWDCEVDHHNGQEVTCMSTLIFKDFSYDDVSRAVEAVKHRLARAAKALSDANIPYAVVGGNAVALWVARVDQAAVRSTQDVDIILRREDLDRAKTALAAAGFIYRHVKGIDMFLDGAGAKARDAVHVIFAAEKVRPEDPVPAPDVTESEQTEQFTVLSLEALVRMKLTANRRKDQVHLEDMLDVGLIDQSWVHRVPSALASRLQHILDTPDG